MCLALPWEVIERVIDHSADDTETLRSFALTCRDLHPRSAIHLYRHLIFWTRGQTFDLCDVLRAKPHLQPCVTSVSVPIGQFSPHPLLRMLPHLSEIKIYPGLGGMLPSRGSFLPSPFLRSCHQFGQHIQSLSLANITFRSLSDFAAILLSFPRIHNLSCSRVTAKQDVTNQPEGVDWERPWSITRRLSQRLHLRTLRIDPFHGNTVVNLLMQAQRHSLVSLTGNMQLDDEDPAYKVNELFETPSSSKWLQLTSVTWKMGFEYQSPRLDEYESEIQLLIGLLQHFHLDAPNLREVALDCLYSDINDLLFEVLSPAVELLAELEKTLIMFPTPTISFSIESSLSDHRYHFWTGILRRFFPVLAEHRALKLNAKLWRNVGHDGTIQTIATSADGRWAATGAYDRTIIIWDLESRCISQEWFTEDSDVDFLAFSPDSRYIMSVGRKAAARGEEATFWDIHQGGCRVISLMREDHYSGSLDDVVIRCVWSPDGTWVAAGPQADGATHIWDTSTFQRLHLDTTWECELLAVSYDGHWVVTAWAAVKGVSGRGMPGDCWIWNADSGKLHRSLVGHTRWVNAAAFDRKGTRVVTGSFDSTIRIWDVESGELLVLQKLTEQRSIADMAFSGDDRMVLSHSKPPTEVDIWDASSGTLLTSLSQLHRDDPQAQDGPLYEACFSPCGSYLASASRTSSGKVLLWRTSDWSCIGEVWAGGESAVTHVTISPDGKVLCCGTKAGTVFFGCMQDLVSAGQG